jgi:hypothetical protein
MYLAVALFGAILGITDSFLPSEIRQWQSAGLASFYCIIGVTMFFPVGIAFIVLSYFNHYYLRKNE